MSGFLQRLFGPVWRAIARRPAYDIGLHIGLERLTLVQLQPGAGTAAARPEILAVASISHGSTRDEVMADPAGLKKLIRRAFAEQPFSGNRIVTCLPSDRVRMLLLSYAATEGASESEAVIQGLRERAKEDLEGMVVDYIPVRQVHASRPKEAIVAIAARDAVTAYLDVLSDAGLQVVSLDVMPAALARIMSWANTADAAEPPNVLLVSFGFHNSYLTVVWGRRLMLDRPVEFAEKRLLARLKSILGIAEADGKRLLFERGLVPGAGREDGSELSLTLKEVLRPEFAALKEEVTNTLVHTASRTHGRSVDGIYVTGGIARYPGFEELLREQFAIPVSMLEPCSIFKHRLTDQDLSWLRPSSGVAVATGLALRGVPVPWPMST